MDDRTNDRYGTIGIGLFIVGALVVAINVHCTSKITTYEEDQMAVWGQLIGFAIVIISFIPLWIWADELGNDPDSDDDDDSDSDPSKDPHSPTVNNWRGFYFMYPVMLNV